MSCPRPTLGVGKLAAHQPLNSPGHPDSPKHVMFTYIYIHIHIFLRPKVGVIYIHTWIPRVLSYLNSLLLLSLWPTCPSQATARRSELAIQFLFQGPLQPDFCMLMSAQLICQTHQVWSYLYSMCYVRSGASFSR